MTIHLPRSKRDQEGKGADVALPRMRARLMFPPNAEAAVQQDVARKSARLGEMAVLRRAAVWLEARP